MPAIPKLQLTHGQVAWALCGGQKPDRRTLDSLRYLRQLGVPFTEDELGIGRGNRLAYGFEHLIECAVAMYAIRRGMKPHLGAGYLIGHRLTLHKLFRKSFRECSEEALQAPWVRSLGRIIPTINDEHFIRLHERYADTRGKIETMTLEETMSFRAGVMDLAEHYDTAVFPLVPLKRVMLEAVAWALEAPITKPGRVPASSEDKP